MPQADTAIEIEGLRRTFGTTAALDGVSLTAPAARVLGLLGPNGAGRQPWCGSWPPCWTPTAGTARVLGHDVVKDASLAARIIGLTGRSTRSMTCSPAGRTWR